MKPKEQLIAGKADCLGLDFDVVDIEKFEGVKECLLLNLADQEKEALPVVLKEKVPVDELTLSGQPFVFSILFFGFETKFLFVLLLDLVFLIVLIS